METGMSRAELERVEVMALRQSGQVTQAQAARRLGITERQVRRLEARVASHGAAGLRSRRRGKPSNRRIAAAVVSQVPALIRTTAILDLRWPVSICVSVTALPYPRKRCASS
jgi:Winged helix-turn helix